MKNSLSRMIYLIYCKINLKVTILLIVGLIHNKIFPVLSLLFVFRISGASVEGEKHTVLEKRREARLLLGLFGQKEQTNRKASKNVKY